MIQDLLLPLKQQVNAVEFSSDDALLERNLRRALSQILSMCRLKAADVEAMASELTSDETEGGYPVDFACGVIELAAAYYRYGEAYSDTSYRFSPSFEMMLSKYRRHYNPFTTDESTGL